MKRIFTVTVKRSDGVNVNENISTPGTDTLTNEKRAAENALQAANPGSDVTHSVYQFDIHREL